jgi:hypothetical protein
MRESEMPDKNDEAVERRGEDQAPKSATPDSGIIDPNDVVPVPVAMEPAELDERAQVVEALRARQEERSRGDESAMGDEPSPRDESGRRR